MKGADLAIVRLPPREPDPFYLSLDWRALRERVFARDGYRCVIAGCGRRPIVCDHIVSRRNGAWTSSRTSGRCAACTTV